jgi:hypothetical protein
VSDVIIETEIYYKSGIYWKDSECTQPFTDQHAARILWGQKNAQRIHLPFGTKRTPPRSRFSADSKRYFKFLILVLLSPVLVAIGQAVYEHMDETGTLLYHDRLTLVSAKSWSNGEYKNCTAFNEMMDKAVEQPLLECDAAPYGGELKQFKVRFYGSPKTKTQPRQYQFHWKCKKNGTDDPAITCKIQLSEK